MKRTLRIRINQTLIHIAVLRKKDSFLCHSRSHIMWVTNNPQKRSLRKTIPNRSHWRNMLSLLKLSLISTSLILSKGKTHTSSWGNKVDQDTFRNWIQLLDVVIVMRLDTWLENVLTIVKEWIVFYVVKILMIRSNALKSCVLSVTRSDIRQLSVPSKTLSSV